MPGILAVSFSRVRARRKIQTCLGCIQVGNHQVSASLDSWVFVIPLVACRSKNTYIQRGLVVGSRGRRTGYHLKKPSSNYLWHMMDLALVLRLSVDQNIASTFLP